MTVTVNPCVDGLDLVVERLVAAFGADRRSQVEKAVSEAWHALRTIADLTDRRVTAERLARIELHARSQTPPRADVRPAVDTFVRAHVPAQRESTDTPLRAAAELTSI